MSGRPSVTIQETSIAGAVAITPSNSVTAYVIESEIGEAFKVYTINSEQDLVDTFGAPTTSNVIDFNTAKNFLFYGSNMLIVRAVNEATAKLARIGSADFNTFNTTSMSTYFRDYNSHTFAPSNKIEFFAKSPFDTTTTNIITVAMYKPASAGEDWASVADTIDGQTTGTLFNDLFEFGPDYSNDEVALVVLVNDEVKETWIVSTTSGKKNTQNENIYITDYLSANSAYINGFANTTYSSVNTFYTTDLLDGSKGTTPTTGDFETAYSYFMNKNDVTFDYIFDGVHTANRNYIMSIADARMDCVAFIGVPNTVLFTNTTGISYVPKTDLDSVTSAVIADRTGLPSSSWACYYNNWKEVYDKYLDKNIWIPCSSDAVGNKVAVTTNGAAWTPAAGTINGQIRNILRLAFNPTSEQQDLMYKNGINNIIRKAGKGFIIDGQRTMINRYVGVSRLNIRDLFRVVERDIATIAEDYLHDVNDEVTRARFTAACNAILTNIQTQRGLKRFQVICDETNNTDAVINAYGFNATVKIEGYRTIENITIKFFDVPAGVAFEEVA